MIEKTPPYFVLTGPPGAGKTSVLEALPDGLSKVAEPARRVLKQARRTGSRATGEQDPALFVERMRETACNDYDAAKGATVFDRGLPDLLAFCAHYELPAASIRAAMRRRPYRAPVYFFPAWRDIFRNDEERKLDFAGALAFGKLIERAYLSAGYEVIHVPETSVADRVAFICQDMSL